MRRTAYRSLSYLTLWGLAALALGVFFARSDYNAQGGILVGLALAPVGLFLVRWMAGQAEPGARWFLYLVALALVLKLAAGLTRMQLNIVLYGGLYDAGRYHNTGWQIAQELWQLNWGTLSHYLYWGTRFTEFYSGLVHSLTGPTVMGAYLVFSLLAFFGSFFYYQAFRVAFPQGSVKLGAALLFLYPSVIYWANGLGKDALVFAFSSLAAYGSARLLARSQVQGLVPLALGLVGMGTIRPHVAGMVVIALLAAFLLRRSRSGGIKAVLVQGLILLVGVALLWHFTPRIMAYVGLEELSEEAATAYFDRRQGSTGDGGSAFEAPSFTDPLFAPKAIMTVLYRPFIWEAHNLQALVQAADGALLLALSLWRGRAVLRTIGKARSNPYTIYILTFVLILSIALMTVANFGTLARQRTMLLPLALMLLAAAPLGVGGAAKRPKQSTPGAS